MQQASVSRKKDTQIINRARAMMKFVYALGKGGVIHTKCGTRSLCGEMSSVKRYNDMMNGLSKRKRGRACKHCKELSRAKLVSSGSLQKAIHSYWDNPQYVGGEYECDFGLFKKERAE